MRVPCENDDLRETSYHPETSYGFSFADISAKIQLAGFFARLAAVFEPSFVGSAPNWVKRSIADLWQK
jgi:hypothetical protein